MAKRQDLMALQPIFSMPFGSTSKQRYGNLWKKQDQCTGSSPLDTTFIALVPKVEDSSTPDKYRPIALCNVIYKLISKILANRLKPLLPLLISPEQIVYVEGRQILDGIILSHEVIHSLKVLKKPSIIIKLDLSKAFDKLSWSYINQMLLDFGFSATWTCWLMNLITSTSYYILLNGSPSSSFRPSKVFQGK